MNKKVLTLCAAMLLTGSLTSVYATNVKTLADFKADNSTYEVANVDDKKIDFTADIALDSNTPYLVIDQDDVIVDGHNYTFTGRLAITGKNVTVKNLTIKNIVTLNNGSFYKNAISVVAEKVTLENNTIICGIDEKSDADNLIANGIVFFPTASTVDYKLSNNTIENATGVAASDGSSSSAIIVAEGVTATGQTSPSEVLTDFDGKSLMGGVTIKGCDVDYSYGNWTSTYTTKAIQVTPMTNAAGQYINAKAIQDMFSGVSDKTEVIFKGTAAQLMEALGETQVSETAAVQCSDMNVLFNGATAPENGKPSNIVSGGAASAPATMGGYKLVGEADKLKGYYLLGMTGTDGKSYVATSENRLVDLSTVATVDESYLWKMTESTKDGNYIYTFTNYATGKLLVASSTAGTGEDTTFEPVDNQPYNGGLLLAVNGLNMDDSTPAYYGLYKFSEDAASLVEWKELVNKADYFNIVSKEDATEGKVLSVVESNGGNVHGLVDAETVLLSSPEAQWYISDVDGGKVTFKNRENTEVKTGAYLVYNVAEGVYKINGEKVALNAVENVTEFDGFKNYSDAEMANATYTIASYSAVRGDAYFAENHKESHKIGLTTDVDAATTWSLDKFNASTDTIEIENKIVKWNADAYTFDEVKETLKVLSYAIQNEANGEYIVYNNEADNKFYTCAETANDRTNAIRFALKAQPNGTYNLVEVDGNNLGNVKMYAGDSEKNGMLNRISTIYDQTENDLFTIASSEKRDYRRVANLDTIAIYREANPSELLFEQGENGINFLGYKNDNQFKFAPNMVAVETYSDAENDYYKPEYMLVVDPTIVPADTAWCDATTHKHETLADSLACAHTVITPAYITGRFLVNYADSAAAWTNENIHPTQNPYLNNGKSVRLGFVEGTYTYDKDAKNPFLAIKKAGATKTDTLMVSGAGLTAAEFAFKYVDANTESFNMETEVDENKAAQFIKLINGVAVLNNEESTVNPEVFNISEDYAGDPTSNETIATSSVVVAGVNGAVVVKGAEGKNVIVSTILGKVVANEVVSSDNATIAAPQGVVVVSVDGESFKVVVK